MKLRGRNVPRPLSSWEQSGLPSRALDALAARGFAAPTAIQAQALPVLMSGRDLIAVARTGSGKTLAYLLPALRHVADQPPLADGDGCIALLLAPSRELVVQIAAEARRLARPLGLRVAAVYGGAPVADQIADLKRGAEIVVAAPGRLIDLLTLNKGRVMPLTRVSYVVLDEADRMFDMGFAPQVGRVLANVRPDRQVALFSATFPGHVEALARALLRAPIEIVVGGRCAASATIAQSVEVRAERDKFPRLLQLLGDWCERGAILVFVDTKEHVDILYADLVRHGYPCLSLHGGQEQADRDATIADFKRGDVAGVLVATPLAGRGLDVRDLVLVVNYCVPDHLEDYVHRVGRTGRAGRAGTAVTFITPEQGRYAADMVRALRDARQSAAISPQLLAMADEHLRASGVALVDVAHWASEYPWCGQAAALLRNHFGAALTVGVCDLRTDPWNIDVSKGMP